MACNLIIISVTIRTNYKPFFDFATLGAVKEFQGVAAVLALEDTGTNLE